MLRRRFMASVLCGGAGLTIPSGAAWAKKPPAAEAEIAVPIVIAVAVRKLDDKGKQRLEPVVTRAFVEAQLEAANEVFKPHGLRFFERDAASTLPESAARLETSADRDALASSMVSGVANVYFVESLRDVDDPKLYRMGVCWRKLSNLKKKYVIVAASAQPTTLAHELGHYLGNPHSFVKNNLMSYDRDGGKVFLDDAQGQRARKTARGLFASKELAS
jgi:hypothetical protein